MRQDSESNSRLTAAEAHNVKDWMERKHVTQKTVAERMGIRDKSYVNRLLNPPPADKAGGASLSLGQLRKLCNAVGMPLGAVFSEREDVALPEEPDIHDLAHDLARLSEQMQALAKRPAPTPQQMIAAAAEGAQRLGVVDTKRSSASPEVHDVAPVQPPVEAGRRRGRRGK